MLYRVGLAAADVGWKISSSYWLDESRCVVLVGRLIWGSVNIVFFVREDEVSVVSSHGISLKCTKAD